MVWVRQWAFGLALPVCMVGCSSSDEGPTGGGGDAGTGGASGSHASGAATTGGAQAGTGGKGGTSAAGGTGGTKPATGGASSGSGGNVTLDPASMEKCQKYCDCYNEKCSVFVDIPNGEACMSFCSHFVANETVYTCRFGMCFYNSNGPSENNNNHCEHSVGLVECLAE